MPPSLHSVRFLSALVATGCGGGLPLLHPAQTLDAGDVRLATGLSASASVGELAQAVRAASSETQTSSSGSRPAGRDEAYAKGALVEASVAPGLAPFVAARVGIGNHIEGGLTYTGRAVRADVRRSFELSRHWSLSAGAGGAAALGGSQGEALPDVALARLHGWGADVPVLVGYASDADLYRVWAGGRAGWEHVDVEEAASGSNASAFGTSPVSLSATRLWGGGLVGLAVGFRHVHLAMEIDFSYASITGTYAGTRAAVAGLTLAPASSVWWVF
ncbi:MAG: hypothetical protein M3O46_07070 [Myxococcota bacterium]|nr:hypothetical protein [Myxococcota bacterium]